MTNIEKDPYKGVRDFYPEDMASQNHIINTMRKTAESFGYIEYSASVLEPAELYRAKSGEEIVNEQTYTFTDRGGRDVTLRPEMTPTLARMIAKKKKELAFPIRWYSIPNLFRYERPQKGRLREHWQLNVDIFGVEDISAETEIIEVASNIMRNFGVIDDNFEIRINDRALIDETLKEMRLNEDQAYRMKKLLDKKNKIDNFQEEADNIAGKEFNFNPKPSKQITDVINTLKSRGISNTVFDPYLMRGFDYYTGIVFEVFDKSPENNRSLFGGGRYDRLLEIFGEEKIPAMGFGMGDVTMRDVLETYNLIPEYRSSTDLYICTVDQDSIPESDKIADILRKNGVNVAVDKSGKKIGSQIEYADKKNIPFVICIGKDEIDSEQYKLKNLKTGEENSVAIDEIPNTIKRK
ncbi:histidine--tRNA ligase [Candidatus Campbellbacteria bacterium CG22_combo_CG10-13_8_21_14_all_36_13]|uniref:Histidine--tRNA ligase n=1 Tax=Candidatus Campbellbacteria bacterium CG22_combo_CG10-13_8_21_14_all_36_13 TaxID=1974529 RepID=A0A2H0DYE9_9BACT|nr:MAG: histidine--tRNA ligase [Candidatus Campbellbacteria bacterium CG22_combo_CG10-13_8_21_14_all_36_13]